MGHVENAAAMIGKFSLLIHPSFAETYGYVLFEAADLGVPVVAMDMPVMNEFIPYYVPGSLSAGDPESFAEAIECANRQRDNRDSDARLRRSSDFSPEAIKEAWHRVLHSEERPK
jgi:glycosyltransferase involved in cell wall biosynthesis